MDGAAPPLPDDFVARKELGDFLLRRLGASEPCTEFSPIDFAWVLRIVPRRRLGGIGGAHDVAIFGDRILAFEHLHHHRARRS